MGESAEVSGQDELREALEAAAMDVRRGGALGRYRGDLVIATIFVDLTNDFVNGALPNPRGHEICVNATRYMREQDRLKIATRDVHDPESPWTYEHLHKFGKHGVPGSAGVQFYSAFQAGYCDYTLDKGWHGPGASAFDATTRDGWTLLKLLDRHRIQDVEVCGLVAEICVWETILDSIQTAGRRTTWLVGLSAAMNGDEGMRQTAKKVLAAGGFIR